MEKIHISRHTFTHSHAKLERDSETGLSSPFPGLLHHHHLLRLSFLHVMWRSVIGSAA